MSRNYKKIRSYTKRERAFVAGNILSFLSGLSIGLLVAFIVFLRYQLVEPGAVGNVATPAKDSQVQTDEQQPELKFTFYDTLRNKKVNISEWVADEKKKWEGDDDKKIDETLERDERQESDENQGQLAERKRDVKDRRIWLRTPGGFIQGFQFRRSSQGRTCFTGYFCRYPTGHAQWAGRSSSGPTRAVQKH